MFVAFVSYQMVRANREAVAVMQAQLNASQRPYIQITPFIRPMTTLLLLSIRNTGGTAARNLTLSMDKDFYFNGQSDDGSNLRRYTAFSRPIESLSPLSEMTFHLGLGSSIFSNPERCPQTFSIKAEYDFRDQRIVESTTIDLQPLQKSAKPVDAMVERLDDLNNTLSKIHLAIIKTNE
jgi:hypothetical protein